VNVDLVLPLDTLFTPHAYHLNEIADEFGPSSASIDVDGAGRGNALCAECHFRTHGTTYAVDGQTPATRLVSFAPNVQPYDGFRVELRGRLEWDALAGSCTLKCHGVNHAAWTYPD
jgi:hypothetical protein